MKLWDALPALLLGWPAILFALALSVAGIVRKQPLLAVVAVVLVAPISLYLAGSPRFWWLGLSIPLLLAGASFAIRLRRNTLAWGLVSPVFAMFGWLAVAVITQ